MYVRPQASITSAYCFACHINPTFWFRVVFSYIVENYYKEFENFKLKFLLSDINFVYLLFFKNIIDKL